MRTGDDPVMHAQNLSFGDNAQTVGINPQADRTIGKGGRYAVAIAFELDQAGWRDALGLFDKPVKGTLREHEVRTFAGMDLGDAVRQFSMLQPFPTVQAAGFQPGVQRPQSRKDGQILPDLAPGILQLDATPGNHRPVLAPVKLEGFPGLEAQGHENTTTLCLACLVLVRVSTAG